MIWIVGRVSSALMQYLKDTGTVHGLLHDRTLPLAPTTATAIITADFSGRKQLLDSLAGHEVTPMGFVIDGYEQYVEPLAWLNERYGLEGLTTHAAEAARNKIVMRQAFDVADTTLSPQWAHVAHESDLLQFMRSHAYPVMLKPTNLSKSRFVTKNESWEQLSANYQQLRGHQQNQPCIVEEVLEGSMHTVTGHVGYDGTPYLLSEVADCVTAQQLGRDDNFIAERNLPSALPIIDQQAIVQVAARGVRALDMRGVGVHVEIMLTKEGPKIIEIAARLGGYRQRMYQLAYGINLFDGLIQVAQGQRPTHVADEKLSVSVIEIFPKNQGLLQAVIHLEQLKSMDGVQYVRQQIVSGQPCGPASRGYKAAAIIMLAAKPSRLKQLRAYIQQNVTVDVV